MAVILLAANVHDSQKLYGYVQHDRHLVRRQADMRRKLQSDSWRSGCQATQSRRQACPPLELT
jgi:hypothetical protein